jgi:hypothetical protein
LPTSKEIVQEVIDEVMGEPPVQDSDLSTRKSVPTYLKRLDHLWRGGWSWQWPIIIAGPEKSGKTQFLYQLLASSLLSFHKPWLLSYSDLAGNFRPERIQSILGQRLRGGQQQWQLGRLDKLTLNRRIPFDYLLKINYLQPNLALWALDGFEQMHSHLPFSVWLEIFVEFSRRKQAGVILTIRGSIEELLPHIPWTGVPFFLYFSPSNSRMFRLRVWQNGPRNKIYDRRLTLNGYFREVRNW